VEPATTKIPRESEERMADDWTALEAELAKIVDDASYKPLRPLVEQFQALVGSKSAPADAGLLLSLIHALHDKKISLEEALAMAEKGDGKFVQPGWNVGKVFNAAGNNVVLTIITNNYDQLKPPTPGIPVPIVLVAMTAPEAADLASGAAFKGEPPALREEFETLEEHLVASGLGEWKARYAAARKDWRPWLPQGEAADTIEKHIEKTLALFKDEAGPAAQMVPHFLDLFALVKESRASLRRLRSTGSVVIIDVISLRHPALMRALQVTLLDAYPASSVLALAPLEGTLKVCRGLTSAIQLRLEESELARRLLDPTDVCEEMSAMTSFSKWTYQRIRDVCAPALKERGVLGYFKV
jgi:hypothetical protein